MENMSSYRCKNARNLEKFAIFAKNDIFYEFLIKALGRNGFESGRVKLKQNWLIL